MNIDLINNMDNFKMAHKHSYLIVVLSFFLQTFSFPSQPCVKTNKITPSYLNFWSDTEKREYKDCRDTSKYYLKLYEQEFLNAEGNIINNQKEGIWKKYFHGSPWFEELYFHNTLILSNSFDGSWSRFIINDSVAYETEYSNGKLQSRGLRGNSIDKDKLGVWEEIDSTGQKSYGKYAPKLICDTFTGVMNVPPFLSYDTVVCYQRKDSVWYYFDEKNKLIKIEIYDKGKLIK
jgi:hypothetical protein